MDGAGHWPAFAAALEDATGLDIGYDTTGTMTVALDASDRASLDDLLAYQHTLGLEAHRRSTSECRRLVPALSPSHQRLLSEKSSGAIVRLVADLEMSDPARLEQFRREYDALASEYFENNFLRQDYLITRATKI